MFSLLRNTVAFHNRCVGTHSTVSLRFMAFRPVNVIFTEDVQIGGYFKGEERNVKRGFARNFLFPNKLAVYATPETKKEYAHFLSDTSIAERDRLKSAKKAQKRINRVQLVIKRHRMEDGSMHAPVDAKTIVEKMWIQHQIELSLEQVELKVPITAYGNYTVNLRLLGEIAPLKVSIKKR